MNKIDVAVKVIHCWSFYLVIFKLRILSFYHKIVIDFLELTQCFIIVHSNFSFGGEDGLESTTPDVSQTTDRTQYPFS